MRGIPRILAAALVMAGILMSTRAYAQGGATGAISGVVVDTSGGSVAEAEVQIIDTRTESLARKISTNADGSFVVPLLPPGTYIVVVNKSGFAEAKASGIEVRVTETTKVTIALKPGAVSEKVEISAQITRDRKSTRLNSSHGYISYAVFCLKKKNIYNNLHSFATLASMSVSVTLQVAYEKHSGFKKN